MLRALWQRVKTPEPLYIALVDSANIANLLRGFVRSKIPTEISLAFYFDDVTVGFQLDKLVNFACFILVEFIYVFTIKYLVFF